MKYKLYKAGKFIVTASIMLGSVMMISQGDAHADTEDSNCLSDTTQVERSQEKPSNSVTLSTNGVASEDNPEVLNSEEKEISSGDNSDVTSDASPENDGTTSTSVENEIPDTTTSADSISNPSETSDTESEPEQTTVDTETKADSEPDKSVNSSQDSDKDLQAVTVKPDIESTKPTENDTNEQKVTDSVQAETRAVVKNGWVDGKYYINNVAATGFYTVSNKFYRFVDGVKQTGWQTRLNQNDWYYFGTDGVALSGLQHLDGGYKYFDASYVQAKNAWRTTGQNRWYFLNSYDGKAVIGLQRLDGGYKYFDNNGVQAKNAWRTTGQNHWYFLNSYDGKAVTGLQHLDGGYKYFDNSGVQAKNTWRTTGQNRWYFLSSYDGKAVTGLQVLDGRTKYFDDNGIQVKNQWRNLPGRSIHTNSYDGVVDITTLSHTWYSQLNQGAPEGCEATALQIALSVKGRWASLQDIYNRTGYGWYGNPDSNFYGNPWGGGTGTTQTVTARRLAEATKSIYGGIENLVSASVADIEREIGLGNAVVTWGDYTWRLNQAFHVMTIVGMNQDSFLISDPYSTVNKEYWISKGTWAFINGNESANGWNLPKMMNVVVR
ncbi:C39 family peptidase [Weissella confusa]|uniref:C39 family peptidase n=1 Tax=Weissella confusa TaxID=1583 RepID=UPI0014366E32|nr:C39 family peptidase [Weissella confusa]